jgi:hypothetical protein
MKALKLSAWIILSLSILMFTACSGGVSDGSSGTVSMNITDAKPVLPAGAENLWITFEEVLVHKAGSGWISLPLAETSYTIDLLQFYDGNTTELVPPVSLESGKYTQIRIVVSEATIRFDNGSTTDKAVEIPSENLKTDKNFTFDVVGGGAVDITVDFDLSQSIVVTDDGSGTLSYKLKPVLHIVDTFEAATITGRIDNESFVDSQNTIVTVFVYNPDIEEYTKIEISKSDTEDPTEFSIFWLVPDKNYRVEIDFGFDPESENNSPEWCENVSANELGSGEEFTLDIAPPLVCQD